METISIILLKFHFVNKNVSSDRNLNQNNKAASNLDFFHTFMIFQVLIHKVLMVYVMEHYLVLVRGAG